MWSDIYLSLDIPPKEDGADGTGRELVLKARMISRTILILISPYSLIVKNTDRVGAGRTAGTSPLHHGRSKKRKGEAPALDVPSKRKKTAVDQAMASQTPVTVKFRQTAKGKGSKQQRNQQRKQTTKSSHPTKVPTPTPDVSSHSPKGSTTHVGALADSHLWEESSRILRTEEIEVFIILLNLISTELRRDTLVIQSPLSVGLLEELPEMWGNAVRATHFILAFALYSYILHFQSKTGPAPLPHASEWTDVFAQLALHASPITLVVFLHFDPQREEWYIFEYSPQKNVETAMRAIVTNNSDPDVEVSALCTFGEFFRTIRSTKLVSQAYLTFGTCLM